MTAETQPNFVIAGETVAPGQPGYFNALDQRHYKAIASDSQEKAKATVIFMGHGVAGGKVAVANAGLVIIGATLTPQTIYVVSATSGLICPIADLATDDWVTLLGIAKSTTELNLLISHQAYQVA